jgi:DNA-damage-inducible protein J
MKTALIQTRVEPDLKAEVERILREIGISTSEAITIFLNRVKLEKGIPFELKIPNARTLEAMKDIKEGRVEKFKSSRAMFESMMDDAENS